MARVLVWTCGGLVAAGVILRLLSASAGERPDAKAPGTAAGRPASSTPAPSMGLSAPVQFELSVQEALLRDGMLVPPPPGAPADLVKAYEYALQDKAKGVEDRRALQQAAQKVFQEKIEGKRAEAVERRLKAQEKAESKRKAAEEKQARQRAELPPEILQRREGRPRIPNPELPPPFVEDPANPLPKPAPRPQ